MSLQRLISDEKGTDSCDLLSAKRLIESTCESRTYHRKSGKSVEKRKDCDIIGKLEEAGVFRVL
jgi:hypothetical protein